MLLPAGAATKGLRIASKAANAGKGLHASRAAGELAGAAGLGAIQAPDIGETRGGNAVSEAISALGGEALGYGLSKAARGINKTDAGQRMLDEGVALTPGQATSNAFIRGAESVGEVTPVVAHGVKRARQAADDSVASTALQKAAAPGKKVTKEGTEGVSQLKEGFQEAYGEAWDGATTMSNEARKAIVDQAVDAGPRISKKQRRVVKNFLDDFKVLSRGVTPQKYRELDNTLRKAIASAKKDHDFQEILTGLRKTLRDGAPNDVAKKLAKVDEKYGSYLVMRRAAKNAAGDSGKADAPQLVGAMKAIGRDAAGTGDAPMQQYITDAMQTAGQKVGGQPLEWFRRVAGITPTPFPMQAAGRAVLGQTGVQKGLTKSLDAIPEYLKRPGIAGAALLEEED